jgi:hypothetical protein
MVGLLSIKSHRGSCFASFLRALADVQAKGFFANLPHQKLGEKGFWAVIHSSVPSESVKLEYFLLYWKENVMKLEKMACT